MQNPSHTVEELGVTPTPVAKGLRATVDWLQAQGRISIA